MIEFEENESLQMRAFNILGFCPCGRPSDALEYIRGGLQFIYENFNERDPAWSYERYKQNLLSTFGSEGAAMFFFYWADKEGLTDHGGQVPGWLEISGEQLLDILNQIEKGEIDNGNDTQTSND